MNSAGVMQAGFPFDEDVYSRRQDIRSHLDDLAQRHPEFADQLRGPPWGSEIGSPSHGTWGRKRRGSGDEENQSQAGGSGEARQPSEESAAPRGRPRQGPIPQYGLRNTVDLGQQQAQGMSEQEDRDGSRGQRSWSAPPDNRTAGAEQQAPQQQQQQQPQQRFVSRINITPSSPGKPPPAPQKQPQQTSSNVRHIPIFVEGRDEPLLPKHAEEPEQIFTQRVPPQPQQTFGFSQPQTFTSQHIPVQRQPPPPQQHHQQPPPKPQQQAKPQPVFTESRGVQEERVPAQKIPVQHQQKPAEQQVSPNDPISRVQMVQKDVENLQQIVEKYSGNSRQDKDYVYLDEMLTRNLLKLDDIETEGKENVRQARRDVIKNIQRCISILESKVPLPEDQSKASEDADLPMEDLETPLAMEAEAAPVPSEVSEKMEVGEAKGDIGDVDMKEESTNAEEIVTTEVNQQEEEMEVVQPTDAALGTAPLEPDSIVSEAAAVETPVQENNYVKDDTSAATQQPSDVGSQPQNPVVEVSAGVPRAEAPVQDSGDAAAPAAPVVEPSDGAEVSEAGDKDLLKVETDTKKKRTGKKSKSPVKKGVKVAENKQENEVEKG